MGGLVGGGVGRELLLCLAKGIGLLGTQALELGSDTGLNFELEGLLAGCVGLELCVCSSEGGGRNEDILGIMYIPLG